MAKCLAGYADHAVLYGEHPDDHAGDQFYNHVPRMLMTQFIRDRTLPCEDLQWLCDRPALSGQAAWCAEKFREAEKSYGQYLRQCEATAAAMTGAARVLFQDTLLLQAQLYALWAQGGAAVCAALEAGFVGDWQHCFTGTPVAPERLAEIRTFTVKPQGHGIGLKNIYERLSMLYQDFVFDFDSDETGTTVRIVLRQSDLKAQNLPLDA